MTLCTNHCGQEIIEAIIRALAPACPERAMAGWGRRFRIAMQGVDPRTAKPFIWHLFQARPGGGGSSAGDGWPGAGEWQAAGGIKFGSIEVQEVRFPLHFRRHEFRPDSGGDGRYRGGPGGELEMVIETGEPAVGNTAGDGVKYGACGLLGGEDGKPHHYWLQSAGRPDRELKTKETGIVLRPGDVLHAHSGGGGGWGEPKQRTTEERAAGQDARFRLGPRGADVLRIGIDVGGTFTDLVCVDAQGAVTIAKVPSTPDDQSLGRHGRPRPAGRDALARSQSHARAHGDASCTARRSRPTRCSSTRARRSACSPPKDIATSSRCARG